MSTPEPKYDPFQDDDYCDMVTCDHCEQIFEDGHGNRLGKDYICDRCYYTHPVVVGGVMAAILADIKAGK